MSPMQIIENGILKIQTDKRPAQNSLVVYEVLRIVSGIPLFFSEHFARMNQSCQALGFDTPIRKEELLTQIVRLSKANQTVTGNIKIEVTPTEKAGGWMLYFIAHSYPTLQMYQTGVEVGFLHAERMNPALKIEQPAVRERANQLISEKGFYEVLLINNQKEITEGSRSNIFFIAHEKLITPPLKQVLKGITLGKVLEIARAENIEVEFRNVAESELKAIGSMFLTGTSPKILPVAKAGDMHFDIKHPMLQTITVRYNEMIQHDLEKSKKLISIVR